MSKRGPAVNVEREQQWRERLQRWKSSGQSVRHFCAAESIREPAFYFWRRVIAERDGGVRRPAKPKFVPVRVTSSSVGVEVVVANGRVVKVHPGFDAHHLRAVLTAVESTSC